MYLKAFVLERHTV